MPLTLYYAKVRPLPHFSTLMREVVDHLRFHHFHPAAVQTATGRPSALTTTGMVHPSLRVSQWAAANIVRAFSHSYFSSVARLQIEYIIVVIPFPYLGYSIAQPVGFVNTFLFFLFVKFLTNGVPLAGFAGTKLDFKSPPSTTTLPRF